MKHMPSNLLALVAVVILSACGDSPTGSGNGNSGGDDRVIISNPMFATDIQEIFTRTGCTASNCHGTSMQGGLGLASAGASFADLVNVASTENPNILRVIPRDAPNSYLVLKLEGSAGTRMPVGRAPLDNIDMTNVMNWINTGAPNN